MKAIISEGGAITPAGNHINRIYSIVDIGMQESPWGQKRQIIVSFELVNEKMDDGRPFVTSKWYNLNLSEGSNLCNDIEAMFGRTLSDNDKISFPFEKLLNHASMINIVHEEKDGKTRAKPKALTPLPKGTEAPALYNDMVFYDLDNPDSAALAKLPDWIKDTINDKPPAEDIKAEDELAFEDDDLPAFFG